MAKSEFTTEAGNVVSFTSSIFDDYAVIVPKYGQGCNYATGKCVEGYQIDYEVEVRLTNGETKNFHIVFQSRDRSDNMRAYSPYEMYPASQYGADSQETQLDEFVEYNDDEIMQILGEDADNKCKCWFFANCPESDR